MLNSLGGGGGGVEGRASDLGENAEKTVAAHKVKCFCEVNESNVQWLSLFSPFPL